MHRRMVKVVCIVLGAALLCAAAWYVIARNQLTFYEPRGHAVLCEHDVSVEEATEQWLKSLLKPYLHFYTPAEKRIIKYEVDRIESISDEAGKKEIRLYFHLKPKEGQNAFFDHWDMRFGDGYYFGDWVITYTTEPDTQNKTIQYTAASILTGIQYDISQYNLRGQREKEEHESQNVRDIPYIPGPYPYKIENGVCSVSYDAGKTWIETPFPVNQAKYLDIDHGRWVENALQEGSYLISPEKTVFIYGGFDSPFSCLYSDDQGEHWTTVRLQEALKENEDAGKTAVSRPILQKRW